MSKSSSTTPALNERNPSNVWILLGFVAALGGIAALTFAVQKSVPLANSGGWEIQPLGLSLQVASRHRIGHPPDPAEIPQLYALGVRAQQAIQQCVAKVPGAPHQVELLFQEGIVSLASGAVSSQTPHGRCVNQVLEGLWGEIDQERRLMLFLRPREPDSSR